jgi:hypothetical protein
MRVGRADHHSRGRPIQQTVDVDRERDGSVRKMTQLKIFRHCLSISMRRSFQFREICVMSVEEFKWETDQRAHRRRPPVVGVRR